MPLKKSPTCFEERNAIAVFSRSEIAGTPKAISYFQSIGCIHLVRVQKQVRLEENYYEDISINASLMINGAEDLEVVEGG